MLVDAGLALHPFARHYLDQTRHWVNCPELSRLLGREKPVTETEHAQWYESVIHNPDVLIFAVVSEADQRHIGNVWLWNIDRRHRKAEVRIVLGDTSAQNKGAGSRAIAMLSDYAFTTLNLHKLYAYVLDFNLRARKAFEKAGFELEGTLKQDRWSQDKYVDVFLLGRLNPTE